MWDKFLPSVSKAKEVAKEAKPEEKKESTPNANLQSAWRYSNLLENDKNAGEISSKPNVAMGKGLPITYKFDCSKTMGDTISGSLSHKLDKKTLNKVLTFDSSAHSLDQLWEQVCEAMQSKLSNEEDDRLFRLLLPDLNQFIPQLQRTQK
mmetsp:Transcript_24597/g.38202  ORF Transcript_24597/g.38202 Transcript_24597/m.38202 type:complete len:150 (-) Transcript_24597:437-886(-)